MGKRRWGGGDAGRRQRARVERAGQADLHDLVVHGRESHLHVHRRVALLRQGCDQPRHLRSVQRRQLRAREAVGEPESAVRVDRERVGLLEAAALQRFAHVGEPELHSAYPLRAEGCLGPVKEGHTAVRDEALEHELAGAACRSHDSLGHVRRRHSPRHHGRSRAGHVRHDDWQEGAPLVSVEEHREVLRSTAVGLPAVGRDDDAAKLAAERRVVAAHRWLGRHAWPAQSLRACGRGLNFDQGSTSGLLFHHSNFSACSRKLTCHSN